MKFEKQLICHSAFLQLLTEEDLDKQDCISVVDDNQYPLMIFLGKAGNGNEFEVRIYKANPADTYVHLARNSNLSRYESNDEFTTFVFKDFISARHFLITLQDFKKS